MRSTQWVKASPSPGFSAGTNTIFTPASRVPLSNMSLATREVSAPSAPSTALASTPINRAPWVFARPTQKDSRSTDSAVGSR